MDGWSCIGVDKYANSKYRKGTAILTSIHAFIDFFIYLQKESRVLKCYEKKLISSPIIQSFCCLGHK